jgi:hypothetical protein
MWTLMTMDPFDDHPLILSVEDLATSTLHGICSLIGVLFTRSQFTSNLQKRVGAFAPFLFVIFIFYTETQIGAGDVDFKTSFSLVRNP